MAFTEEMQIMLLNSKKLQCDELRENYHQNPATGKLNLTSLCDIIWDGIMCWPASEPGQLHLQECPAHVVGFQNEEYASKYCHPNGTWLERTNFTQCYTAPEATIVVGIEVNETLQFKFFPIVRNLSHIGYGISLFALIIAFLIVASLKRLRCPRNMLHLHLFVSFILKCVMGFLKASLFEQGVGFTSNIVTRDGENYFVDEGNWVCKLLTTLWQYFIMANYSWILMEGLYIHNLIMWALSSDGGSIFTYILLGWGLPMIFVPFWAVGRIFLEDDYCWTVNRNSLIFYIVQVPTTISILINFSLFVNIVRLLMDKLRLSMPEERQRYRQLAKSTLILVALFGVPYFAFLGLYFGDEEFEIVWLLCNQLFASFQGLIVALLYCYLNGEVQDEIKNIWRRTFCSDRVIDDDHRSSSCGSWSSSYSMARGTCSFYRLCRLCRNMSRPPKTSNIRSTKRAGTVNCIVCETCPTLHDSNAAEESEQPICPDVEMKLMQKHCHT